MGSAKPISMSVRPYKVAHLCFEVGGIMDSSNVELGSIVTSFSLDSFCNLLQTAPTTEQPSRLLYDSQHVESALDNVILATLRRAPRRVALDNAINGRQNAYFAKYANVDEIVETLTTYYSGTSDVSKASRLAQLVLVATSQYYQLQLAYETDGRLGVVRSTESSLVSDTTGYGYSAVGSQSTEFAGFIADGGNTIGSPPAPPAPMPAPAWPPPAPEPPPPADQLYGFTPAPGAQESFAGSSAYQVGSSTDKAHQTQSVLNTNYSYRIPYLEALAQSQRAQISLIDQQAHEFMHWQNLPNLKQVFKNELTTIDNGVFRLQVDLLNCLLTSPISGTVTGVYKNPGEAIKPGEPVFRVEDPSIVYLMATIIYRGPIVAAQPEVSSPPANSTATIQTNLFDQATLSTSITGLIVSARGYQVDDKWDVIVKCRNLDNSGNPIFPLGYRFDYDNTTVTIS